MSGFIRSAVNALFSATGNYLPGTLGQRVKDLSDTAGGKGASLIGLSDASNIFTASNVEAALEEAKKQAQDGIDYVSSPTQLYRALADPLLPLPSFFSGWAQNSFHGVSFFSPSTAGIPLDEMNNTLLEYTVSGVAGAAALTISAGDQTKGAGTWGAVVQHDDGTYGSYTVSALGAGVCTVHPNVRSTITAKTLGNLGGTALGQHFTERGYQALARKVFATPRSSAYRNKIAAKWTAETGRKEDWAYEGGAQANHDDNGPRNNCLSASRASGTFMTRNRISLGQGAASPFTGKGRSKVFALGGTSGYMELFASCADLAVGASGGFYAFKVKVVVDGVTLLDQTYTENDGLQRIQVPYAYGLSATVTITMADEAGTFPGKKLYIDSVTWFAYDRTPVGYAWADSIIDKNAKTVVLGDSWSTFYSSTVGGKDGALVRELQAAMTAAGGIGQVVGVGTGGTTAEFGLTEFDSKVKPENPAQVVICYFTNDHNTYGVNGYGRWLTALYKIGRKCQAIGARPIFIMPMPTQSVAQAIDHGIWADKIGAGLASL